VYLSEQRQGRRSRRPAGVRLALGVVLAIAAATACSVSPRGSAASRTIGPTGRLSAGVSASSGPASAGDSTASDPGTNSAASSVAGASTAAPTTAGAAGATATSHATGSPSDASRAVARTPLPSAHTSAAKPPPVPPTTAPAPTTVPARPGGRPGPANTGVPAGTGLTVINGDLVVKSAGAVVDAKDIKGSLIIEASNVTVQRSLIEGGVNEDSVVIKSGSGILLQDDEVTVAHPTAAIDAMSVQNVTINRLNIHGGVDGMKLSSNSLVENSWIHGLDYFAQSLPPFTGPTHNDTIQIMSGSNIRITGNYLQAVAIDNSAIQITQDGGTTTGVSIVNNWGDGGGCTFNFSGHGPGGVLLAMSGISATGNRFGRDTQYAGCAILVDLQTTLSASGNVFDDNGQPIVIQRHN
jgi:hypothetical protein